MTTYTVIFDLNDKVKSSEELREGKHTIKHGEFQIPIIVGLKRKKALLALNV